MLQRRWPQFWVYGAILREAGLTPDDSEVTMKATGKAPSRVILGYNSQGKAWFAEYDPRPSGRIAQSLEPARAHAELKESDKQNRYAAELWKAHAKSSGECLKLHARILELLATQIAHKIPTDAEIIQILREAAAAMRRG